MTISGVYYKHLMIVNDNHKNRHNLERHSRGVIYNTIKYDNHK